MVEKLRNRIRTILFEAIATSHFKDRSSTRLSNQGNIRPPFPQEIKQSIQNRVSWIRSNVVFDEGKSYQIHIQNLPQTFKHWEHGKGEASSQGDMVYLLVKENRIESIFFRRKPQRGRLMDGVDIEVSYDYLTKLTPGKGGVIFFSDYPQDGPGQRKVPQLNLPIVNLLGKEWFVDVENERIIYLKNTKKTLSFDDAIDTLPEKEAEKIFTRSKWKYFN